MKGWLSASAARAISRMASISVLDSYFWRRLLVDVSGCWLDLVESKKGEALELTIREGSG